MENFMVQHVGVFYKNKAWALAYFDLFLEKFGETYVIEKAVKSQNDMYINFKDGSWIKFFSVDTNRRDVKCDRAIIELDIDNEKINTIIRPNLMVNHLRPIVKIDNMNRLRY